MHPITSHVQAQLVGQDRLRTAGLARRARSAASEQPRARWSTTGLLRRVLGIRDASAPTCAPGELACSVEISA